MRVGLILGIVTSGLLLIIGLSTHQFETYSVISGTLGIICFLLAGIVSDSFISGDRARANYYTESKQDRKKRIRYSYLFFLLGAPNLLVAIVLTLNYM
ncbi:DUF5316 domain-containing protein [Bacillus sp. 1P02SD]|uniref:DUF5316 domain-containing protein n=1 Tax=Bacillus sp. 1P02SD TaxID=3132264 RepID=UPI0039A11948